MLMLPRCLAALCLPAAAFALPTTASAAVFKDRVVSNPVVAHAAQTAGTTARYPTGDGGTIPVTAENPTIAQQYATFVGTLPHGAELNYLHIVVVPAAKVNTECGGSDGDGILACYGNQDQTMIVPDSQATDSDVSVDYVIAHEYGHHIAAHRSNAPLPALDFGPKRWSSYELVCGKTIDGKLAPGDENLNYLSNPGEAWAESYARLVFPLEAWRFTSLLKPTSGSLLAAMADVMQPWKQRVSTTFTGDEDAHLQAPADPRRRVHAAAQRPQDRPVRHRRALRRQGRGQDHDARLVGPHPLPDRLPRPPDREPPDHRHPPQRRNRRRLLAQSLLRGLNAGPPRRSGAAAGRCYWPDEDGTIRTDVAVVFVFCCCC